MPNLQNARAVWKDLEPRGQLTLVVSFLLVAVTAFLLFHFATKPSYTAVQTGLDPSDTGRVTQALASAGIPYKVTNGGTQVEVPDAQQSQAEVALAQQGATPGTRPGWELFDHQSLGTTQMQEQVNYQRALEGEITRTLEGISGVSSAEVHLALPKDTLFDDQASQARASVLLEGGPFDSSAVSGVAHMVASSVQGLDPQNITVTDSTGAQLWPAGSDDAGGAGAGLLDAEESYGAATAASLDATLTQILGPGKAVARVHADLDMDKTTQDSVTYDKKTVVPLTQQEDTEQLNSNGSSAGGAAGTATNVPPTFGAGASAPNGSNYKKSSKSVENGVDKTVEHREVAPGEVKRLDVGLLIDKSVPAADVVAVKAAVSSAVGLDTTRGDTLTVSQVKFAPAPAASSASGAAGPLGLGDPIQLAKYAVLGLAVAVFLFLVRRSLKRREGAARVAEPTWLREIQQTMPIAALGSGAGAVTAALPSPEPANEHQAQLQQQMHEIVSKSPDQVAIQVAQWMAEK